DGQANIYPFPGLSVIDVSDPGAPRRIAHLQTPGGAFGLAISGSKVFIAANLEGLQIVDISNPSQPALIGSWTDGSGYQAYGVAANGSVVYLADSGNGLKVLDVSNPSAPILIGSLGIPTRVLTLSGSTLYLQSGGYVFVVDVTDPTAPAVRG